MKFVDPSNTEAKEVSHVFLHEVDGVAAGLDDALLLVLVRSLGLLDL